MQLSFDKKIFETSLVLTMSALFLVAAAGCQSPAPTPTPTATSEPTPTATPELTHVAQANPDSRSYDDRFQSGRQYALALESDQTPAVRVDEQVITAAELVAAKVRVEDDQQFMLTMTAVGSSALAGDVSERQKIIDKAGTTNVALASEILDSALAAKAIEDGYTVNEDTIAEQVSQNKQLAEDGEAPSLAGAADVLGDRFWDEILPQELRDQQLIGQVQAAAVEQQQHQVDPQSPPVGQIAVMEADIEVLNEDALDGATLAGALAYLSDYWALDSGQP